MKGLFWGLLTIDLHFFADHYPDENTKTKVKKFNTYIGGPATNAAITFQHLGGNASLVTAIGRNAFRAMILDELSTHHVEVMDMNVETYADPVFASILTNQSSGSRTVFSYHPPNEKTSEVLYDPIKPSIALFDGFYVKSAIQEAKLCRERGIVTVMDGGSWKHSTEELLKYIDIAICSEDFMPPGIIHPEEITEFLLAKGVEKVAITRGSKSIIVNEGAVNTLIDVPHKKVVDTLGAGDIFHGAFCYYYADKKDFGNAINKAAFVASLSCQYQGPRTWMQHHRI